MSAWLPCCCVVLIVVDVPFHHPPLLTSYGPFLFACMLTCCWWLHLCCSCTFMVLQAYGLRVATFHVVVSVCYVWPVATFPLLFAICFAGCLLVCPPFVIFLHVFSASAHRRRCLCGLALGWHALCIADPSRQSLHHQHNLHQQHHQHCNKHQHQHQLHHHQQPQFHQQQRQQHQHPPHNQQLH